MSEARRDRRPSVWNRRGVLFHTALSAIVFR